MTSQLHAQASLSPRKECRYPLEWEAGQAPKPVWTPVGRDIPCFCQEYNHDTPVFQPVTHFRSVGTKKCILYLEYKNQAHFSPFSIHKNPYEVTMFSVFQKLRLSDLYLPYSETRSAVFKCVCTRVILCACVSI